MSEKKKSIFIAAGGTGGHIFLASALAQRVIRSGYKAVLITDERGEAFLEQRDCSVGQEIGASSDCIVHITGVKGFSSSVVRNIIGVFKLYWAALKSMGYCIKYSPCAVVSLGGYAAAPALLAALCMRKKIILHEQNAVMGVVNRFFVRFADKVVTSFEHTRRLDNKYSHKVVAIGNPVCGSNDGDDSDGGGSDDSGDGGNNDVAAAVDEIRLTILGGSQGAKVFTQIAHIIALMPDAVRVRLRVKHQVRSEDINDVCSVYVSGGIKHDVRTFFADGMGVIRNSDIIISRAGALTIAEILHYQKVAIIIPMSASKDNHQYYNAREANSISRALTYIDEADICVNAGDSGSFIEKLTHLCEAENLITADKFAKQTKVRDIDYLVREILSDCCD